MDRRSENDSPKSREERLKALCQAYGAAVLAGDEVAAEEAIRDALAAGLSTSLIDDEIIAPALWLVGDLWQRGEISVADEHLATEISLRVLALSREVQRVVDARRDHRVLLATPAAEHHVVALRMVDHILREAGYDVVMLGPDVPPAALAASAGRHRPDVVCLSATVPGNADQLLIAIDEVRKRRPSAGFVIGGRGVGARVGRLPGIDVCTRVSDAVEAVDAIIKRPDLN